MLRAAPALPPPPNEQEGKCQLGFVLCSSGCRSSHLLKPTQLLIGRLAGLGGGGLGTALVAAGCQRWTGWRLLEDLRRQEDTGESSRVRTTGVAFCQLRHHYRRHQEQRSRSLLIQNPCPLPRHHSGQCSLSEGKPGCQWPRGSLNSPPKEQGGTGLCAGQEGFLADGSSPYLVVA